MCDVEGENGRSYTSVYVNMHLCVCTCVHIFFGGGVGGSIW